VERSHAPSYKPIIKEDMKRSLMCAIAVGATSATVALGSGVATADSYAGQKYSDAAAAAGGAKKTIVIASRVGSRLALNDCIVTRSQNAPFLRGNKFKHVTDLVQFYLNCNGRVASPTNPGNSSASPEGRARKGRRAGRCHPGERRGILIRVDGRSSVGACHVITFAWTVSCRGGALIAAKALVKAVRAVG